MKVGKKKKTTKATKKKATKATKKKATKATKKKATKNKKRKKNSGPDPEKSETSKTEKKQQADIDTLKTVAEGGLTPLPLTEPLGKSGKRTRGPDKQPRKPRSDRGQKRDPALDDDKQPADQVPIEHPAPTSPQASPAAKAYLTTKALAVTADNTVFKLFPPKMTQLERSAMIDAWTPVVELHIDSIFASPYFVPVLVSVGVLAPRVGAKFSKKRKAARPKRKENA